MGNNYFKFKQFTINQSQCSMKVGTDGVLLGAWSEVGSALQNRVTSDSYIRILDIGAGSGVISLIAAQRNPIALIEAVELDQKSAIQCAENFQSSLWSSKMSVQNISIQDFTNKCEKKYNYILSNPPYFNNSLKNESISKSMARHTDNLLYEELAECVEKLLAVNGIFSAIFPYVESSIFIAIAAKYGLYCKKRLDVRAIPTKPIKRVLLQFSRERSAEIEVESLDIELGERHLYSKKYIELTKPFYLKF